MDLWCRMFVLLPVWRGDGRACRSSGGNLRNEVLVRCKRANYGHSYAISKSPVHNSAEENLALLINMPAKFLHEHFHFRQRHARATRHMYKDVGGVCEHAAAVH